MNNVSLTILERQNDETALKLLKASTKCYTMERIVKYIMITLSFLICLAAILNRYIGEIFTWASDNPDKIREVQDTASTYINLISGAIICVGIVTGFYVSRMHSEATALQDRYEAYVFRNAANKSILRPVSQSYIDRYAQVSEKNESKYLYHIYPEDTKNINEQTAQYDFIKSEVKHDYDMYLYIQPFFLTIWIGFCILVIGMAISFNDDFITTLINILIPSLSAITTIATSWYNCRIQMRQLNNLLNCIERVENLSPEKKKEYISDPKLMRQLADGLFNYRLSPFVIPVFLQKSHDKQLRKKELAKTVSKDVPVYETKKSPVTKKESLPSVSNNKTKVVTAKPTVTVTSTQKVNTTNTSSTHTKSATVSTQTKNAATKTASKATTTIPKQTKSKSKK